ncbi:MAG TPA: SDR family NAD(P)-dependent oxidoreductase [Brevibacterium sp.]|nr:SDR family NAD(P)-dependent oxidoreductase [Brevibacterium sp.]HLS34292.1 SDR family NAD(P)-dependent oxidoreductase [Brevibacterium sp.]
MTDAQSNGAAAGAAAVGLDLTGRVVVVTGGNRGIGLGMARGLVQAGASVAVWGRSEEANAAAVEELRGLGGDAASFACDVADEAEVTRAMAGTLERFGRLDTLFANAGVSAAYGRLHELTLEDWRRVSSVNIEGVILSCQAALRTLMEQGEGGSLVLVSSLAGVEAPTRNTLYGATKAAVLSLMRGLATEYAREGIRTNAILPGWIETEMTQGSVNSQKFTDKVISRVPFRKWGTPEDFAAAAVFLAGSGSSFVNGQQVVIDGGYTVF